MFDTCRSPNTAPQQSSHRLASVQQGPLSSCIRACLITILLLGGLTSCSTTGPTAGKMGSPNDTGDFESQITFMPIEPGDSVDKVEADVTAYTDRIHKAIATQDDSKPQTPSVQWINDTVPAPRVRLQATRPDAVQTPPAAVSQPTPTHSAQAPSSEQIAPRIKPSPGSTSAPSSRTAIIEHLTRMIRQSDDSAAAKTFALAVLASLRQSSDFDADQVDGLTPSQGKRLNLCHKLLTMLRQDLTTDADDVTQQALKDTLSEMFAHKPISIRNVHLVKRVDGWGVYDEFADNRFVAGQENPMIIYVELDNYKTVRSDDGRYQVRLAQEIELYTDHGDAPMIWRQSRQEVVDKSRNRRHDFFVRQVIRLPATLNVGKYWLKLRVVDLQDGARDEISVPVILVADARMVEQE